MLGGVPFGLSVLTGVAGAPVAHGAGIVPAVALIQGALLSRLLMNEPIGLRRLTGIAVTLVGLSVLVAPDWGTDDVQWWGDLAYVLAGVFWGGFTVMLRYWQIKPLEGAAFASVFSSPYLLVYAWFPADGIGQVAWQSTLVHGMYQGVAFSVVAVLLYGWGIGKLGAVSAVAAMPLMPVFGLVMEWSLLGREATWNVYLAIVLIAGGVMLNVVMRARPALDRVDRGNPADT